MIRKRDRDSLGSCRTIVTDKVGLISDVTNLGSVSVSLLSKAIFEQPHITYFLYKGVMGQQQKSPGCFSHFWEVHWQTALNMQRNMRSLTMFTRQMCHPPAPPTQRFLLYLLQMSSAVSLVNTRSWSTLLSAWIAHSSSRCFSWNTSPSLIITLRKTHDKTDKTPEATSPGEILASAQLSVRQ